MRTWNRLVGVCLLLVAARAEAKGVGATPASVAFAKTAVGVETAAVDVTYDNQSGAAVQLLSVALVGPNAADYVITANPAPAGVGNGGTAVASVAFKPLAGGSRLATLEATFGGNVVVDVPLSGTGVGPSLTITPNPIDLGGGLVGVARAADVTLKNAGGGTVTIPFGGIRVGGPSAAEVKLTALPPLPATLAAGQGVTVKLTFTPAAAGLHSATLDLDSNDPMLGPTANIPIVGRAGDPAIRASVGSVIFGKQRVGTASAPQAVDLQNSGNSDLTIKQLLVQDGNGNPSKEFALTAPPLPLVIHAQATAPLGVSFTPTALGARSATLLVASDDPKAPNTSIRLSGSGSASKLSVAPPALDFGSAFVYQVTPPSSVVFTNSGDDDARIVGVTLDGPQGLWFRYASLAQPPLRVPAGGTARVDLQALPLAAGLGVATVTFQTDDPQTPSITIPLKVNAVRAAASCAPAFLDAGAVAVGVSQRRSFTCTNNGDAPLSLDTVNLVDDTLAWNVPTPPDLPLSLPPGASTTIDLTFTPPGPGDYQAELDLDFTGDPSLRHLHLPLGGVGALVQRQVAPALLAFGSAVLGGANAPLAFTITNGGALPFSVKAITLGGVNPNQFQIVDGPSLPLVLGPGASRAVAVAYVPTSGGTHTATVTVTGSDGFAPATVQLTGSALAYQLLASTTRIDFLDVYEGTASTPITVGLKVPGSGIPLTISAITSSNPEFAVDSSQLTASLGPSGTTHFDVYFVPSHRGQRQATLNVFVKGQQAPAATITALGNGFQSMGIRGVVPTPAPGCRVGGRGEGTPLLALLGLLGVALRRRQRRR